MSTVELGESSHVTEQEIIPSSMPAQSSEQDWLSGGESVCIEPGSCGVGVGVGVGEPDLQLSPYTFKWVR